MLKKLWSEWKIAAQHIGDFQSRLILSLFYFTIFVPFGLLERWTGRSLDLNFQDQRKTAWVKHSTTLEGLDEARRHF